MTTLARRIAGGLLAVLAVLAGVTGGFAVQPPAAELSGSRIAALTVSALAAVLVSGGLALLSARVGAAHRLRVSVTCSTLALALTAATTWGTLLTP
ncbi:hypothetical protein [Microtetraspora sp. NBRC 13810]|uniref:hypothetical protein n=1 Tax=Microtetraspora sp. NBRC 13810 TaxID=3030990 RepID=UPI002556B053|nr:hypothetical protein [Microtetraspora sp. NBRC 13810]